MIKFAFQDPLGYTVKKAWSVLERPDQLPSTWKMAVSQMKVPEVANGETDRERRVFSGRIDKS